MRQDTKANLLIALFGVCFFGAGWITSAYWQGFEDPQSEMIETLVFTTIGFVIGGICGYLSRIDTIRAAKEDVRPLHRLELAFEIINFFAKQSDGCLRPIWPEEILTTAKENKE